jgi:exodeoxyribonuclease V beta subunit
MNRFNCLSIDTPIFGPHLLEASAGTGKTFAIEHVFVRLILKEIPLEEILAVTFTRASTRELKARIRSNLEKALLSISSGGDSPHLEYLLPYVGSKEAIFLLTQALKGFDRCQIFTIHSFCFRMLNEFAFEAGQLFSLQDAEDPAIATKLMRNHLGLFWHEGIDPQIVCPEQLAIAIKKFDTMQELGTHLLHAKPLEKPPRTFKELYDQFCGALNTWTRGEIDEQALQEDFAAIRGGYKVKKGDFEVQIHNLCLALHQPHDSLPFRKLIQHGGSLFSFLSAQNRKVKAKEVTSLHYPGFFDWAISNLQEIIYESADQKNILGCLIGSWKEWQAKHFSGAGIYLPDEILEEMKKALDLPPFLSQLQKRFKAVIIDEFQDTDPLQWEIFQAAFLKSPHIQALYLVGDPKQSIYRFRKADVYTYYQAREILGNENLYQLDTNFRSSKEMIHSLNSLFSRNWLYLPKKEAYISYTPVQAGSAVVADFEDEKKALHWIIGGEEATFQDTFLPYAVAEIEKLKVSQFKSVAILVKDRNELQKAVALLRERQIPCVGKSHQSLAETFAFRSLREVFDAILSPFDENLAKIVENGPYRTCSSFLYWNELVETDGLAKFFCEYFSHSLISADLSQVMEELFAWEQRDGFSFKGLERFLNDFEKLEVEEGARRRMDEVDDAVQILTLHISKGLEFDIVFALALATPSPLDEEEKEELKAEKLRQLYVAMTRAKKRLYVPYTQKKGGDKESPIQLFCRQVERDEGPFIPYLEKLSKIAHLSYEEIPSPFVLPHFISKEKLKNVTKPLLAPSFTPSFIQSFTSLAHEQKIEVATTDPNDLPRGKETGTIIHSIFEAIFEDEECIWKEDSKIQDLIEKKLLYTSLKPWTELVKSLVCKTISLPLFDGERTFCLRELERENVLAEMEFIYVKEPHYVMGFIDLVFRLGAKFYIIDWKTNQLNAPTPTGIDEMMKAHDYELQASLYTEAMRRHFGSLDHFGGVFYLFLRAPCYVHLIPESGVKNYG